MARSAARGAALTVIPNATDAVGTSLDAPGEVEALKNLPPDVQRGLIERAKGGEKVSAKQAAKRQRREQRELELGTKIAAMPDKAFGVILRRPVVGLCSLRRRDRL